MAKSKYDPYREEILSGKATAKEIALKIGGDCKETHIFAARRRFLNSEKCLESTRKWRQNHPSDVNKRNREYRAKHSKYTCNKSKRWTEDEDEKVMSKKLLAKDIAKELGRTIIAIYSRRVFLNKQTRIRLQNA